MKIEKLYALTLCVLMIGLGGSAISLGPDNTQSIVGSPLNVSRHSMSQINMTPIRIQIDGNEEFHQLAEDMSWPGTGSEEEPIIISNQYFYGNGIQPVRLWNTDLHWIFRNNMVSSTECGFWSQNVTNGLIIDTLFTECHMGNIHIDIKDVTIKNCTYFNVTSHGISVDGGEGLTILDSNITANGMHGISFQGVNDSIIMNNTIMSNPGQGILLDTESYDINVNNNTISDSQCGVFCSGVANEISENVIFDMTSDGVKLFSSAYGSFSSSNNSVEENTFINCSSTGVYIQNEKSSGNVIMENDFFECGSECQVFDEGTENLFLNNYYHDWTSPDDDTDGFVDVAYSIDGDSENEDAYPLAAPHNPIPDWFTPSVTTTTTTICPCTSTTTTSNTSTTTTTSTSSTTSEVTTSITSEETTTTSTNSQEIDMVMIGVAAGAGILVLGIIVIILKKR
ncbi:MAG: right-handed parallel beta-helix repeat-containing protein [Candidatus Thorarchaeota archaeon]